MVFETEPNADFFCVEMDRSRREKQKQKRCLTHFFSRIRTVFAMLLRWSTALNDDGTQDGKNGTPQRKKNLNCSNERLNHNLILLDDCFCLFKYTLDVMWCMSPPTALQRHRATAVYHRVVNLLCAKIKLLHAAKFVNFQRIEKVFSRASRKNLFLELLKLLVYLNTQCIPTGICLQFGVV